MNEKIKEILDRECYLDVHNGWCGDRTMIAFENRTGNPCSLCHKNDTLAKEIAEIKENG